MELELGLKITKTVGDLRSTDLSIAKDRGGTLFLSRETETMFILTAHLKGYRTENIKININKDGTLISIRGEKTIQETIMKGWMLFKNEPEVIGFEKTFRIPKGINLDGINAKYIDDESTTLTISMPKLNKGIAGARIEELLEDKDNKQDSATAAAAAAGDGNDDDQVGAWKEREWHEAETSSKGGGEVEEVMENGEEVNNDIDDDDDDDDEKGVWKRIAPCFFMGSAMILMVVGFIKSKKGFVKSKKPCFCA